MAMCHRSLRRDGKCFVVSHTDTARGHAGTIYRAANFQQWALLVTNCTPSTAMAARHIGCGRTAKASAWASRRRKPANVLDFAYNA
jgi:hypothetical protein